MAYIQLVTFELGCEEYGIEIDSISGIVKCKNYKIFKVPNIHKYIEGIINLRGKVIPIFNLKEKFNLNDNSIPEDSKIVVVNSKQDVTVGFIVDEVTDIIKIDENQIESLSVNFLSNSQYIKGIGKVGDKVIIVLNLLNTLSSEEMVQVHSISNMPAPQ